MPDDFIKRLRANRKRFNDAVDELPIIIYEAIKAGRPWRELAEELKVGKARVYQLRAEGERQATYKNRKKLPVAGTACVPSIKSTASLL